MSKEEKLRNQTLLQEEVYAKADVNIVTCGNCGSVMLHRISQEDIECPFCGFEGEPCDFPDLFYTGFESSVSHTDPVENNVLIEQCFTEANLVEDQADIFVKRALYKHKELFEEGDWYHSGGGCTHILFRLSNGRILLYHHTGDLEISFGIWPSIERYLEEEMLGWEYDRPMYPLRTYTIDNDFNQEDVQKMVDELINYGNK